MADWGKVIEVTELRRVGIGGDVENMYRYRVRTAQGTVFTQVVSEDDTEPAKLNKILGDKARRLDKAKEM